MLLGLERCGVLVSEQPSGGVEAFFHSCLILDLMAAQEKLGLGMFTMFLAFLQNVW